MDIAITVGSKKNAHIIIVDIARVKNTCFHLLAISVKIYSVINA
jgi:hypothetical protein